MAASQDGSVGSRVRGSPTRVDYITVAYSASTGAKLWARRYNGPANDGGGALALGVSPDGSKVYVTGGSDGSDGLGDYVTVAYDASTGARLWVTRYNGPADDEDGAHALGVSRDGSKVFVTGSSGAAGAADYATVAYDASTGAKLWDELFQRAGGRQRQRLRPGRGSRRGAKVVVTGSSQGSTRGADYATLAYSIG
jgi:Tol biopolymer transport system component